MTRSLPIMLLPSAGHAYTVDPTTCVWMGLRAGGLVLRGGARSALCGDVPGDRCSSSADRYNDRLGVARAW